MTIHFLNKKTKNDSHNAPTQPDAKRTHAPKASCIHMLLLCMHARCRGDSPLSGIAIASKSYTGCVDKKKNWLLVSFFAVAFFFLDIWESSPASL